MNTNQFNNLLNSLQRLDTRQNRVLGEEIKFNTNKKHVSKRLESPYNELKCPHCHHSKLLRWGKRNDMQRYRCKSCKKTFNSLTGTPLANLHRKGHWLEYSRCLKNGLSIRKAAKVCGIHPNTSFRWRHRFLANSKQIMAQQLAGIIEVDETYMKYSEKGNKQLCRAPRKRGTSKNQRTTKAERVCILTGRDRNGNSIDGIIQTLQYKSIKEFFEQKLAKDILFCSNGRLAYKKFTQDAGYRHGKLRISHGEVVRKDIVHLQNVKEYNFLFKNWINNHFHGVATKYLSNYMAWYRALNEFNYQITPHTILLRAKEGGKYKHQPTWVT